MPVGWAVVVVVQWVAIVALAAVVLGVLRRLAPQLERAEPVKVLNPGRQGAEVGVKLPAFAARDEDGRPAGDERLLGRPSVLLFLSAGCGPCLDLARDLEMISADQTARLAASLIVMTDADGLRALALRRWVRTLTISSAEGAQALGIRARPFAIAVVADGLVRGKRLVNTLAQVSDLAASAKSPALPMASFRQTSP